jgi:CPA1 family monovalent cation:H+ antiporter
MFYILQWMGMGTKYIYCLLFGALISPTDPIAVLAMVKKTKLSKNLEIKIAGESLFNDGIGVVVFLSILHVAVSGEASFHPGPVLGLFAREVLGGILLGAIFGYFGFKLLKEIENEHVELEVLITLSMVMTGTQIAEMLEISGPLAMVVMGIFIGNQGRAEELANITGDYVFKFWSLVDEAMNAILFILIGLEMIVISDNFRLDYFMAGLISIATVLAARLVSVSIPITILSFWRGFAKGTRRILTWGGLRGGISVALALSLPQFEAKDLIVTITYCVVVFSILVQGLTIPTLLKYTTSDEAKD